MHKLWYLHLICKDPNESWDNPQCRIDTREHKLAYSDGRGIFHILLLSSLYSCFFRHCCCCYSHHHHYYQFIGDLEYRKGRVMLKYLWRMKILAIKLWPILHLLFFLFIYFYGPSTWVCWYLIFSVESFKRDYPVRSAIYNSIALNHVSRSIVRTSFI